VTAGGLLLFDHARGAAEGTPLAGVDEAGRGCWAGPVVAAAVILPPGWCPAGLDDSKRLTEARRETLSTTLRASALSWGACAVSAPEIDRLNILRASLLAMRRALLKLRPQPAYALIDGVHLPELPCPAEAVVKGDGRSAAVAAASVLAKVLRDRLMVALDRHHPQYGFASHKGYGAAVHREALLEHGPCRWHRHSFRPVAELDQGRLWPGRR
jgi:ribonuclease HII